MVDARPLAVRVAHEDGVEYLLLDLADRVAAEQLDNQLDVLLAAATTTNEAHAHVERLIVDRLADELVLAERVASVGGERVHWAAVDLLLEREEKDVEGRAGAVAHKVVEEQGEPVGEHLLGYGLVATEEYFGIVLGLDGALDELAE